MWELLLEMVALWTILYTFPFNSHPCTLPHPHSVHLLCVCCYTGVSFHFFLSCSLIPTSCGCVLPIPASTFLQRILRTRTAKATSSCGEKSPQRYRHPEKQPLVGDRETAGGAEVCASFQSPIGKKPWRGGRKFFPEQCFALYSLSVCDHSEIWLFWYFLRYWSCHGASLLGTCNSRWQWERWFHLASALPGKMIDFCLHDTLLSFSFPRRHWIAVCDDRSDGESDVSAPDIRMKHLSFVEACCFCFLRRVCTIFRRFSIMLALNVVGSVECEKLWRNYFLLLAPRIRGRYESGVKGGHMESNRERSSFPIPLIDAVALRSEEASTLWLCCHAFWSGFFFNFPVSRLHVNSQVCFRSCFRHRD